MVAPESAAGNSSGAGEELFRSLSNLKLKPMKKLYWRITAFGVSGVFTPVRRGAPTNPNNSNLIICLTMFHNSGALASGEGLEPSRYYTGLPSYRHNMVLPLHYPLRKGEAAP